MPKAKRDFDVEARPKLCFGRSCARGRAASPTHRVGRSLDIEER